MGTLINDEMILIIILFIRDSYGHALRKSADERGMDGIVPSGSVGPFKLDLNDAMSACLRGIKAPPQPDELCTAQWMPHGCLQTNVPAWGPTAELLHACLRCCLQNLTATPDLRARFDHWHTLVCTHPEDIWVHRVRQANIRHCDEWSCGLKGEDLDSVLLGWQSDLRFASKTIFFGRPTSWEVPRKVSAHAAHSVLPILLHLQSHPTKRVGIEQGLSSWWHNITREPDASSIVLRSADDSPQPRGRALLSMLNHPRLKHWYATTPSVAHPKVSAYPLGLFDTSRWRNAFKAEPTRAQQRDRPNLIACTCMGSAHLRSTKMAVLIANGLPCSLRSCNASETRERYLTSKFVVSMRGEGAQNYREWEAMMAGAIPLVDYDARLVHLWAGLPVLQVRNWSAITKERLDFEWAAAQERVRQGWWSWTKLFFPFWLGELMRHS